MIALWRIAYTFIGTSYTPQHRICVAAVGQHDRVSFQN